MHDDMVESMHSQRETRREQVETIVDLGNPGLIVYVCIYK